MKNAVEGVDKVIKQLRKLEAKIARKILRTELRALTKQVAAAIKPHIPVDTGWLKRSLQIKVVKKKKRYTVAFRIAARPPKDSSKYYAFASQYGVKEGPGHQPAIHWAEIGTKAGEALLPETIARIAAAIKDAWRQG